MRRPRLGALIGIATTSVAIAVAAANCASPTQIIVSVKADEELCNGNRTPLNQTGIAVTSLERIDTDDIDVVETGGCALGDLSVGDLTITPSGSDNADIGIRVVAALGSKTVGNCGGKDNEDSCIVAKRRTRFTPGRTTTVTVLLSAKCIGSRCGEQNKECDPRTGACVDEITEDGSVGETDANVKETDSGASLDANDDACTGCVAQGGQCDPILANTCTIDCSENGCAGERGGLTLEYVFKCNRNAACANLVCKGDNCRIDCNGTNPAALGYCQLVTCQAESCVVLCGKENACKGVFLDGGSNEVSCAASTGPVSCDDVNCNVAAGGSCRRTCDGFGACSDRGTCTGPPKACDAWADGGDGG